MQSFRLLANRLATNALPISSLRPTINNLAPSLTISTRSYVKGLYEEELDTFNAIDNGSKHSPRLIRGTFYSFLSLFTYFLLTFSFFLSFGIGLKVTFSKMNRLSSAQNAFIVVKWKPPSLIGVGLWSIVEFVLQSSLTLNCSKKKVIF